MSKVIKAGNCTFQSLNGTEGPVAGGPLQKEGCFSRLYTLVDPPAPLRDRGEVKVAEEAGRGPGSGHPAPDPLARTRQEAEEILDGARKEADILKAEAHKVLEEARRKAAEVESEAYAQGFEQGKRDGEELGRRQYEATAQKLADVIEGVREQGRLLLDKYEAQLVQLVLEVARQIVHREVETDPDTVVRCIKAAMELVVEGSRLSVHLNPKDAEIVGEEIQLELNAPGRHPVEIRPDPKVERGGCLLETEFGLVDATLGSRWQAVVQSIRQVLVERTGHGIKADE